MFTALKNADKNSRRIKTNHRNKENQANSSINIIRKTKTYKTKISILKVVQENYTQITIITEDNNHPTKIIIADDLQTEEIHKIPHNLDIADLIVKLINRETTTQDQIQTEAITQIIIQTVRILRIYIVQTTTLEFLHIIENETILIIEKDSTQMIDLKIIQTIDQITTIVTKDHVTTPENELITTQLTKKFS